jgi:hypothetical protein
MRELLHDPFYVLLEHYPRRGVEYCRIEADALHQGYRSHQDAVLFAALRVIERDLDEQSRDEPFPWNLDIGKAHAHRIDPARLFHVPVILRTDRIGQRFYDCPWPDPGKGEQIPYWYAFWEPPHTSGYGPDEFRKVNSVLFPEGTDELEVYEWSTDWSNYFEDGREWWGTACWSIYDKRMKRYVVIMASATD